MEFSKPSPDFWPRRSEVKSIKTQQMDAPQLHKQISSHSLVPWMPLKGLGILERARGVRSILQPVLGWKTLLMRRKAIILTLCQTHLEASESRLIAFFCWIGQRQTRPYFTLLYFTLRSIKRSLTLANLCFWTKPFPRGVNRSVWYST